MSAEDRPPVLTRALLDELVVRWESIGTPVVANLRPGLTKDEIETATKPIGFVLAEEATTWWEWHDGSRADVRLADERQVGPDLIALSLDETISAYRQQMQLQHEWEQEQFETDHELWRPELLPLLRRGGGFVAYECRSVPTVHAAVYGFGWGEVPSDREGPSARSLGEMVTWWLEAIDSGAWRYIPEERSWYRDDERIGPGRNRTRVV